jgi:hypothetical protein
MILGRCSANCTEQGFDYGMSTSIQQGVSTWHGALLNDNSAWRSYFSYGISPRCFFGEKQKKQQGKFLHCE